MIRYQPNGLLASVSYRGIVGQPYTDYTASYGSDRKPASATYSNRMAASYTYLSNSYDVLYAGVTGEPCTAYVMHYGSNGEPITAFYNNGMMATWTYNADGSYAVEYNGVTGASYSSDTINCGEYGRAESANYNNGMTSTLTYADDGARLVAYQGMSGSAGYTSPAGVIDTSGQTVADAEDMNNGSGILRIFGNDVTISSSTSGLDVTTAGGDTFGVNTHTNETFAVSQANSEAFDFSSGFGATSISGLQIGWTASGIIQFDLSIFDGLSSNNTSAQNLADLLASGSAMQSGQNVTISDLAGDVLTLKSVTTSMLGAAANSILKFV